MSNLNSILAQQRATLRELQIRFKAFRMAQDEAAGDAVLSLGRGAKLDENESLSRSNKLADEALAQGKDLFGQLEAQEELMKVGGGGAG